MRTAKTLIRVGGCPGWYESLLGAQSFCWFCHEAAQMHSCCMLNAFLKLFAYTWQRCAKKTHTPFFLKGPLWHLSCDMTKPKPTMWLCAQRRLRSAWASAQSDQSLLCAQWVAKDRSFLHANSEDSDQTGRMPRLIWVFAGRTLPLLVLSWRGSFLRLFASTWQGCAKTHTLLLSKRSTLTFALGSYKGR